MTALSVAEAIRTYQPGSLIEVRCGQDGEEAYAFRGELRTAGLRFGWRDGKPMIGDRDAWS